MRKFDIICILETFLNNTYENNDLNLNGYSLHEWLIRVMQKGEEFVFITKTL